MPARLAGQSPPADLFAGRDRELADLPSLFSQRRLVTLCGPPGIGKTRLALEFCHRRTGVRWDRVAWVKLEAGSRPHEWAEALALHDGRPLLVLDGCEQSAAECASVVRALLDQHPRLNVLATSRQALQLPGEAQYRVPPLPAVPTEPANEWLSASPAVRLFVDRVGGIRPGLDLAGQQHAIAGVCNSLGGVPLAIELAAQLSATMSVAAIGRELAQGIDLLSGPPLGGLTPHASLRESIARSYVPLDPDERRLFRRLALLPGGAGIATAEAMTADLRWSRNVLHGILGRLVHTSMLSMDPDTPGCFTILEPLRAFGREQLHAENETDAVHGLLCAWFAERARTLWTRNFRSPIAELWRWTDGELANLRYAVEVLRDGAQPGYALLAATAAKLLIQRGEFGQSDVLLEQVLASPGISADDEARARCVNGHGLVLRARFDEAQTQLRTAYELAEAAADEPLALQVLSSLVATHSETEAERASALSRTLISRLRAGRDTELLATACLRAAWFFVAGGHDEEARAAAAEAVALRAGRLTEDNLHTIGVVALASADVVTATGYFTDGLRNSAHLYTSLDHVEGLALAAAYQEEDDRALRLLAGAAAVRADRRLPPGDWWAGQLEAAAGAARRRLPPAAVKAVVASGARLRFEELVEYALTDRVPSRVAVDHPLKPREQQVARLIADGHRNRQIAARLSLSIRTVEAHTASIRRKLGLSSRAHIAHWVAIYATAPTDEK